MNQATLRASVNSDDRLALTIVVAIIVMVILWHLYTLFPTLQESRWGEVV